MILVGIIFQQGAVAGALEGPMADEFAALSHQTHQAMSLPAKELEALARRCDVLLEKTDQLKMPEQKIMRRKVERLRGLFLYILSSRPVLKGDPTEK